jgi:hypothetical protein
MGSSSAVTERVGLTRMGKLKRKYEVLSGDNATEYAASALLVSLLLKLFCVLESGKREREGQSADGWVVSDRCQILYFARTIINLCISFDIV